VSLHQADERNGTKAEVQTKSKTQVNGSGSGSVALLQLPEPAAHSSLLLREKPVNKPCRRQNPQNAL
jgi:hypothetical protein